MKSMSEKNEIQKSGIDFPYLEDKTTGSKFKIEIKHRKWRYVT